MSKRFFTRVSFLALFSCFILPPLRGSQTTVDAASAQEQPSPSKAPPPDQSKPAAPQQQPTPKTPPPRLIENKPGKDYGVESRLNPSSPVLKIPDGTPLRLSLTQSLSSRTSEFGSPVHFEVMEDVKLGEFIAIPKGSTAVAHVVEAEVRKRMGRAGKLDFTVDYVKAADGSNLQLRASSTRKGEDKAGTAIVGSVALSPLFLMMRGRDVTISKGTEISAYVDGDREINMSSTAESQVSLASASGIAGTVSFKSEPSGSDIIVDGKFIGITPSVALLSPGEHEVVVQKTHFASWKRTLAITAGSAITIDPILKTSSQ